jgi:polygalacturonase
MSSFDITDFGAVGDGRTLNTRAIQDSARACQKAGGGILLVPAGVFLTGTFEIFSGTTLLVEKGGRLLASPRLEDHVVGETSVGLLYAQDAANITLTGEGTLDGNAPAFFVEGTLHLDETGFSNDTWQKQHGLAYGTRDPVHGPMGISPGGRPGNMLVFARCRNVRIEKLTITGAAYWTLHCAHSEDIAIEKLTIDNDLRHPNNDGIHLSSCRRATIRHCRIFCGDDSIAMTGFRYAAGERQIAFGITGLAEPCEHIEVSDCLLVSRSGGVRIGYGNNPVRDVRLSRLEIRDSNRGIGIFARQADVEDVVVENCKIATSLFHGNWWGRGEPIHVSAVRWPGEPQLFHIRNITFRDIEATGENAVTFFAEEPGAIEDVELTRVKSTLRRGALFETWGGNLDLRPAATAQQGIIPGGTAPLWAIGVSRFHCNDCQWELAPDVGPHFSAQSVIRDTP